MEGREEGGGGPDQVEHWGRGGGRERRAGTDVVRLESRGVTGVSPIARGSKVWLREKGEVWAFVAGGEAEQQIRGAQ